MPEEEIIPNDIQRGDMWNKPKTPKMIQFQQETRKNVIRGGKITGQYENWLYWRKLSKKIRNTFEWTEEVVQEIENEEVLTIEQKSKVEQKKQAPKTKKKPIIRIDKDKIYKREILGRVRDVKVYDILFDKKELMKVAKELKNNNFGVIAGRGVTSKTKKQFWKIYIAVNRVGNPLKLQDYRAERLLSGYLKYREQFEIFPNELPEEGQRYKWIPFVEINRVQTYRLVDNGGYFFITLEQNAIASGSEYESEKPFWNKLMNRFWKEFPDLKVFEEGYNKDYIFEERKNIPILNSNYFKNNLNSG